MTNINFAKMPTSASIIRLPSKQLFSLITERCLSVSRSFWNTIKYLLHPQSLWVITDTNIVLFVSSCITDKKTKFHLKQEVKEQHDLMEPLDDVIVKVFMLEKRESVRERLLILML